MDISGILTFCLLKFLQNFSSDLTLKQEVVYVENHGNRSTMYKSKCQHQNGLQERENRTFKRDTEGLPWWRSGWESACQCRGHGFEPWSGKVPHAAAQLGPWATATEPERLEPVLRNKRGRDSERPAHHDEEWSPLAATRESPRTERKTQHSQK